MDRRDPRRISRRGFLGAAFTLVGAALTAGATVHAEAPAETGLLSEGLLAGIPGFQPRTPAPLPHRELPGFLSRAQLDAHHAEYRKSVEALTNAEASLASADRGAAGRVRYATLRREQVSAGNDVLLHEFYFRNLAPEAVELPRSLRPHMREHMGSFERWADDFAACAAAAKAWAALVYDPYDDRWHNVVMDGSDGTWIGANLLVVCDVAEHAYGVDRLAKDDYVAKFMRRIDWSEVAGRYEKVDRM